MVRLKIIKSYQSHLFLLSTQTRQTFTYTQKQRYMQKQGFKKMNRNKYGLEHSTAFSGKINHCWYFIQYNCQCTNFATSEDAEITNSIQINFLEPILYPHTPLGEMKRGNSCGCAQRLRLCKL